MTFKRTITLLSTIILLFNLISCTKKQEDEVYNMALRGFIEKKVDLNNIAYIQDIKVVNDDILKIIGGNTDGKQIILTSENYGNTWSEESIKNSKFKKDKTTFFSVSNNGNILAIDGSNNTNNFILIKDNN